MRARSYKGAAPRTPEARRAIAIVLNHFVSVAIMLILHEALPGNDMMAMEEGQLPRQFASDSASYDPERSCRDDELERAPCGSLTATSATLDRETVSIPSPGTNEICVLLHCSYVG